MVVVRAFAMNGNWDDVAAFVQMKKPPIPYQFMAEICNEYGNIPLAVESIRKINDTDEKILMFIDIQQWREAIEESFSSKKSEYIDEIRRKGPNFVEGKITCLVYVFQILLEKSSTKGISVDDTIQKNLL